MTQFLETLCIVDGVPLHLEWHQQRVDATMKHFYASASLSDQSLQLHEILSSCDLPKTGFWRCRIIYDLNAVSIEFIPDGKSVFPSLRIIEAPEDFNYLYKYADRRLLHNLFEHRDGADDVLMTHEGWMADTTKANIAFRSGERWYTPSIPFLAGTTWKRLVASNVIIPRPIHKNDLHRYDAFKIFNALNDWDGEEYPVTGIIR